MPDGQSLAAQASNSLDFQDGELTRNSMPGPGTSPDSEATKLIVEIAGIVLSDGFDVDPITLHLE